MTTTAPRFTASTAVFFVALMLAAALPVSTENAQAHVDPTHHIDVDRDPRTYFGFADVVAIRVLDPDRDSADNRFKVTVNATVTPGGSTTPITLYETLPPNGDEGLDGGVGAFVGTAGFSTTSGTGNIVIPSTGDTFTITLVHDGGAAGAGGGAASAPVELTWKRTFDAQMSIGKGGVFNRYVGQGATVQVNVTDLDHKAVASNEVIVAIRTASKPGFDTLALTERGDTGSFFGNFTIRPVGSTSLAVTNVLLGTGDNTRTVYQVGSPVASVQTLRAMNFLKPHLAPNVATLVAGAAADYTIDAHGKVTLTTAGKGTLGTRDLVINYTLPATVKVVTVPVDNPLTPGNEADPNFMPDLVDRVHREAFTVYYQDVRDKDGEPVLRSVAGEWLESPGASFQMLDDDLSAALPAGTGSIAHLFGSQSKLGLRVIDEDANANRGVVDTVNVRIASYTTVDPAGDSFTLLEEETVALTESGPNTAEFTALLPLETVRVANNDILQISTAAGLRTVIKGSYAEARGDNGKSVGVAATAVGTPCVGGLPAGCLAKLDRVAFAATGTGTLQLIRVATGASATEFFGLGPGLVRVRVTDSDITACSQLGSDRVSLRSSGSIGTVAVPFVDGDRVGNACEKVFGFKPPAGAGTCGGALCVAVSDGASVVAQYTDPTNAVGQLNQIITATGTWRQGFDASVAFGGRFFSTTDNVPIVVQDPDLTASEVHVRVTSLHDPGGVNYALPRDTASPVPGTYRGVAKFETLSQSVPNNERVAVANEGTVIASYLDPRRADGSVDVLLMDSAILLHPGSGAAEINAENVYLNVPLTMTVKDGNAGSNNNPVFANVSSFNPALDGVAGTSASDVRDVGETVQLGFGLSQTSAQVPLDFEGRKWVFTKKGNGNANQVIEVERFPIKPLTLEVFVNGEAWTSIAGFGPVPGTGADTQGDPNDRCDGPDTCVTTKRYTLGSDQRVGLAFGRIQFGQSDDVPSIPPAGSDIVVIYEPYEYYNETHVLEFQPFGRAAVLRLKNAAALVGGANVNPADGAPGGAILTQCRDDPATVGDPGTSTDEFMQCFNSGRQLLRGEALIDVFVNGKRFKWCPSADYTAPSDDVDAPCEDNGVAPDDQGVDSNRPFQPGTSQFTIPQPNNAVINLGQDAQVGDTVNIVYRGYDRVAGLGERLTLLGAIPLPVGKQVCQAFKVTGTGDQLLQRWADPEQYTYEGGDSAVAFRARGNGPGGSDLVTFGDVVKLVPRLARTQFSETGREQLSDGTLYYKDEDGIMTGGTVQFRVEHGRTCSDAITDLGAAPSSSNDLIQVQEIRTDPIAPGSTIPQKMAAQYANCIWYNDTRLYTEGLVTIHPTMPGCGAAGANVDQNTAFQVSYTYPHPDEDEIPTGRCSTAEAMPVQGHVVCRGIDEVVGMPFIVRKPLVPGSLAINFCAFPGTTCAAIDITEDATPAQMRVNPRTGQITLVAASLVSARIGDQFRFTAQLMTDWNREVSIGTVPSGGGFEPDAIKVTYFDASNNANALRQITYNVPSAGGRLAPTVKGIVTFNGSTGAAQEEFFGLADYANLTIVDADRNRDPNVVETLTAKLEGKAIGRLGEEVVATFSATVTLFEEGTDSNTFVARLKFGPWIGAGSAPQGLTVLALDLSKGNQFVVRATYTDLNQPLVGATYDQEIEKAIQFRPATRASVTIEPSSQTGVGNPMVVRVTDVDRDGRVLQERVGKSTGARDQGHMTLASKPVKADSQILYVETGETTDVFEVWEEVPALLTSHGTRKVYTFNDLTGQIKFGNCIVNPSGACTGTLTSGRVPAIGAEVRVDSFMIETRINDAFVRLESYYVDPVSGFDASRDTNPFAPECNADGADAGTVNDNPRCYDRVDLLLQELTTNDGVFQGEVPFALDPDPTCASSGVVPCINAINIADKLELPSATDGVDNSVIVATYFDYSYLERYRPRTSYSNPPAVCLDGDGKPGQPFQQLMPGQELTNAFPGLAGTADPDCQSPFGPKEFVQATASFSEATTGLLTISSRNMLMADGSLDLGVAGTADDMKLSQRQVFGPGKLDILVEDADVNANRGQANTATATLKTDSNPTGVTFTLAERDGDDLRFVGKAGFGPGGNVGASSRDKYTVQYNDLRNAQGVATSVLRPAEIQEATDYRWFPSGTGTLALDRSVFVDTAGGGPLELPTVTVRDPDRNVLANTQEQLRVRLTKVNLMSDDVTSPGGAAELYGLLGDCTAALAAGVTPLLTETGASTGVFEGTTPLVGVGGALAPSDGDTILVTYCDPHDGLGKEGPLFASAGCTLATGQCRVGTPIGAQARWFAREHGQVFFDKARYVERNEVMVVTVVDKHDDGFTGSVDRVPVVLRAGTVSLPLELVETGSSTGEFQARVGLQTTDSDGIPDMNVPDNVVLRAYYADVSTATGSDTLGKPGASVAESIFAKDTLPPVTEIEIESELDPVTFGGEEWFRSPPSIVLTAEDDLSEVLRSEYRWDGASTYTTYTGPFSPPSQGRHILRYRSVDVVNNVEADHNLTINWDETAPALAVTEINATKAPGGIQLTWISPVDLNDPLEFGGFLLFRDDTGAGDEVLSVTNTTAIVPAPDEQEHTYYVRIQDAAGNLGPLSAGIEAIADITPPTLSEATVLPRTTFAVGEVAKLDFSVKVLPTPDDVVSKVEVTVAVPGAGTDVVVMADPDGDNTYTGSYANFTVTGLYEVTFRALDAIGNAATAAFTVNVTGRDTTPPTIASLPDNLVVPRGEALRVGVRDNIGVTRVTYKVDNRAEATAVYASGNETALIPTADLAEGAHKVVIRAFDAAGNSATAQLLFVVGPQLPPGVPPPPLDTRFITTASGLVQLRWIAVPSANLDHFEVWRAASPEKKLGDVDPEEDCDEGVCSFTDRSAKAGVTYTYCILAVNRTSVATGFDYPSKSCMEVTCATCVDPSGSFLERFWWIFLIAAAIVVGVAVFLVQREERAKKSRSRQTLETVPVGPGERHHIKCPACATRFTVTGTKPIVTNCPHCGKKGILR